ncbi:MAG: hypothetical protein MRERV_53c010 [Mycoplasmataceae bacterium RV_VA103A]|nr:MAG: hypothetical protein MRERV_53c010 [Mycoplasmataceae bacterium RV_VA103A]
MGICLISLLIFYSVLNGSFSNFIFFSHYFTFGSWFITGN